MICAILSSIFLKEKLTFFGWLGCGLCIVSILHSSLSTKRNTLPVGIHNYRIEWFIFWIFSSVGCSLMTSYSPTRGFCRSNPGVSEAIPCSRFPCLRRGPYSIIPHHHFLFCSKVSEGLFCHPLTGIDHLERYGTKSMLWYIAICSMIGGISVSVTTGLGAAIVTTAMGDNQV